MRVGWQVTWVTTSCPSQTPSLGCLADTWRRRAAGTAMGRTMCLPARNPNSPIAPANLVTTRGRCHAGANLKFVQYQPHANARDRKMNPALFYVRLFMNLPGRCADVLRCPHRLVAVPGEGRAAQGQIGKRRSSCGKCCKRRKKPRPRSRPAPATSRGLGAPRVICMRCSSPHF